MPANPRIFDNKPNRELAPHLSAILADADSLSAATAYFSIYGYGLLADSLKSLTETRLLLGEPASAASPDPARQGAKAFDLTERDALEPAYTLKQRGLALACKEWLLKDGVQARSMKRAGLMHGKAYLAGKDGAVKNGVVGSSNFTLRGLGGGDNPNIELNLPSDDPATLAELQAWFNGLWDDDALTEDVKQAVLDALERLGRDYSPEDVYFKTLYELFRKEMEDPPNIGGAAQDTLANSEIWAHLYRFQQDGALTAINWLNRRNGCILADSVGLGKTYTALAVIKYFESQNQRVLVICPRRLVRNWRRFQGNHDPLQFKDDKFGYTLMAHTDIGRESGKSSTDIELDRFNWGAYDLIVIDESHNFRNARGKRYQWLMERAFKAGGKTKVLMLSATPVNTSLNNIKSQIDFITEGAPAAFERDLGIADMPALLKDAEAQFKRWMRESAGAPDAKRMLINALGGEFIRLMTSISVARSRKHLEAVYQDDIKDIGDFPERMPTRNEYPAARADASPQASQAFYDDIADSLANLTLALYNSTKYVAGSEGGRKAQREFNLVGMMRVNLLKRLESSTRAISATMRRIIAKLDAELAKVERHQSGEQTSLTTGGANFTHDDEGDDDAIDAADAAADEGGFDYSQMNLDAYKADLQADRDALALLLAQTEPAQGDADGKLVRFKADVKRRLANPSVERDGKNASRKLLAFTTFKDTAEYLYAQLTADPAFKDANIAMVSGTETHTNFGGKGDNNFDAILNNFAPKARRDIRLDKSIDILIATDCVSEGQDLQDCDEVLNYDIHWNPVRVIQRFGRIDRIGSPHKRIRMINYWPAKEMEEYLNLEQLVTARAALANAAATGADNALDKDAADAYANYRLEQIRFLKEATPALEDIEDAPMLPDLSAQLFIDQLRRFLERNRRRLEAMPNGVYALTRHAKRGERPCAIFCLRRKGDIDERVKSASAAPPPFYLVSVYADPDASGNAEIHLGCHQAYDALRLFGEVALGIDKPIRDLCAAFDNETQHGKHMDAYNALTQAALADTRRRESIAALAGVSAIGGGRDFVIPEQPALANAAPADGDAANAVPTDGGDFELVTWCIIRPAE